MIVLSGVASGEAAVTGYDYRYRMKLGEIPWEEAETLTQQRAWVEVGGLLPGTTYEVQARTVSGDAVSDWSEPGAAQTLLPEASYFARFKPVLTFRQEQTGSTGLQNAVARTILEYGYGYETKEVYSTDSDLLQRGIVNVHMQMGLPRATERWGTWWDHGRAEATRAVLDSGAVTVIRESRGPVWWQSAFLIPQYTAEANPGLRSVEDLREHWQLFTGAGVNGKAGLITCGTGAGFTCEKINESQIHGYGLDDVLTAVPSLNWDVRHGTIIQAFREGRDILFFYWGPSLFSVVLDTEYGGFYRLEEPPYSDECWNHMGETPAEDVTHACGYDDGTAHIVVRSELLDSASSAIDLFRKWTLSNSAVEEMYAILYELQQSISPYPDESEYREVTVHWLRTSDEWKAWVSEEIADQVLAALQ
ncbi:MAG: hypothetical protein OXL97_06250 [Chloroflexota bacterium]|nr:hypothetical protein [Chloroflexota bacterium]MDE2885443.1 hypothetical protein [Chloroflexota bacterium]